MVYKFLKQKQPDTVEMDNQPKKTVKTLSSSILQICLQAFAKWINK